MNWILGFRIRVFAAVTHHMSFTEAAASLNITQPAVSYQIRSLETELGTRLFRRNAAGLELTDVGKVLQRHLEPLEQHAQLIDNEVATVSGIVKGSLGVAVSMAISSYVLPSIIGAFVAAHGDCAIETLVENSETILNHVDDETIDVGIVSDPVSRSDIVVEPLLEDEIVLIVPPGHRWAERRRVALSELPAERFILREPGSGTRKVLEANLKTIGLGLKDLDVIATIGGYQAVKKCVMQNVGIAVVAKIGVRAEVADGRLVSLAWSDVPMTRNFNLVYSRRLPTPVRVERFMDCARQVAAALSLHPG